MMKAEENDVDLNAISIADTTLNGDDEQEQPLLGQTESRVHRATYLYQRASRFISRDSIIFGTKGHPIALPEHQSAKRARLNYLGSVGIFVVS